MSTPFLSEIRIFSFAFPPKGWAFCNGQIMAINQNQALFSLLGTYYGGNGVQTFALPNLQGAAPVHQGPGFILGQTGGETTHTLQTAELPSHGHTVQASNAPATQSSPVGNVMAAPIPAIGSIYAGGAPNTTMAPQAIATAGSGAGHQNMQPYLALNFCIALQGIFPSRN